MPLKPTDNITLGIVDYPVGDMLRGVEVEYIIISFVHRYILVPRAYDPSGMRQESRALGATISGRLRETGWAEFGYFLCYFKMVAPRALDSCRRPEGS